MLQTAGQAMRPRAKLKIKEAHESFVVLNHAFSSTNPYYLKDRSKQNLDKKSLLSVENQNDICEPFQKVDISRIRSPNIPYVGSNRSRNKPSLLINQVKCLIRLYLTCKDINFRMIPIKVSVITPPPPTLMARMSQT